tara:strand:+ start:399 stop:515 length:117 start_codon:yes stop_codon:yes gene_type:complete
MIPLYAKTIAAITEKERFANFLVAALSKNVWPKNKIKI